MRTRFDEQMRRLMQQVVDQAPPPPDTPFEVPAQPPAVRTIQPRRAAPRWPAWATVAVAFFGALLIGGAVWLLGTGRESAPVVAEGPAPTQPPIATEVEPQAAGVLHATWSLEATYDGWLRPIAFDGGLAAISHPTYEPSGGEVWLSSNGVDWTVAPAQPPEAAWALSSDGETLFAEIGDPSTGTEEIWAAAPGGEWRPVLTGDDYSRLLFASHPWPLDWPSVRPFDGTYVETTAVVAGPPGAVVFGIDDDGAVSGWFYDGNRFVPADIGAIGELPADSTDIDVVVLADRFLLTANDWTGPPDVSVSVTGAVWSDPEPSASGSPLAEVGARIERVASRGRFNLASMVDDIYGLWATDGSSWERITLRASDYGWVPWVAAGDLGWLVYFPPWSAEVLEEPLIWYSPDAGSWASLDDAGPLHDAMGRTVLVRDDHVLVVAALDPSSETALVHVEDPESWEDPRTQIWRLDIWQPGIDEPVAGD